MNAWGKDTEYEIVIDDTSGTMFDITQLVPELKWDTSRVGKAGSIELKVIRNPEWQSTQYEIKCGYVVRIKLDGVTFCYGRIFSVERTEEREWRVVAYDQLRYLVEADTYIKENVKASQVIKDAAIEVGLKVGQIADTQFAIPKMNQRGQKRLDMIYWALDQTLLAKGTTFVFYDNAGELTLKNVADMKIDLILGDSSLVYKYSSNQSIDKDTYNRVKLVREDKEAGRDKAIVYENSDSIKRWGRLQYYQKVDDGLNKAQVEEMAKRFLELRNREKRQFTLDALGYVGVRAGSVLQVTIKELNVNQNYLVEECTHKFSGSEHTMSLELKEYDA